MFCRVFPFIEHIVLSDVFPFYRMYCFGKTTACLFTVYFIEILSPCRDDSVTEEARK
jgi:hypothetical protein